MIKRETAKKVRISDITQGEWVKKEGMEPSYIVTPWGENVSRARILGTVVAKFVAEDDNFASLTIDDSTDTIRAKTFKTSQPIASVNLSGSVRYTTGPRRSFHTQVKVKTVTTISTGLLKGRITDQYTCRGVAPSI